MNQTEQCTINTGDPNRDQQIIQTYQAQYAARGCVVNFWPLQTGGYMMQATPANPGSVAPVKGHKGTELMPEVHGASAQAQNPAQPDFGAMPQQGAAAQPGYGASPQQ